MFLCPHARKLSIHAEKHREMERRADYGLMIWDGASPGTFLMYRASP
jgi:hypothetical protein